MLGASEDAVGNKKLRVGSESSESGDLTIHLVQPMQQPEERKQEQESVPLPEPERTT